MTDKKQGFLVKMGLLTFFLFGMITSAYHYLGELDYQQGKQGSSYPKVVNIGYLRVPNDEMMAIEQGTIEKNLSKFGIKVNFMVFDSGVEANKALASGSIDFASMGVTNGVVALSKGLDVELIWLHELLGTNEALVTRKQEDLKDLHQLSGKTIATTFASTSHYSLKKVLEANNLTDKVTVLDMTTLDIAAAWQRGDIDGAYTWDPVLSELVASDGNIMISSADLVDDGVVTANVMLGRKNFTHQYPQVTAMILSTISDSHDFFKDNPDKAASLVAKTLEISKEDALFQMKGTIWLSAQEQVSKDYLGTSDTSGDFVRIISEISRFLSDSHSISSVPNEQAIKEFINSDYIIKSMEGEKSNE